MAATYDLGDAVLLTFTVRNAAGALTNATVAYLGTKPDGTTDTTAPVNPSTGIYTRTFAADQAGLWLYKFTATGAVTTAEDGAFIVEPNQAADLYTTVGEVTEQLGGGTSLVLGRLERAVLAASRAVDAYCARRFWRDPTPTIRVYRSLHASTVWVSDIATATGLVVKTDITGDSTFATTLAVGTDVQLEPFNADLDGRPWTKLTTVGSQHFPWHQTRPTVQVTARHGWPIVPDDVREAATIKAAHLYRRKDSPDGFRGSDEFGVVRISRFEDPDVVMLLERYSRARVAVA